MLNNKEEFNIIFSYQGFENNKASIISFISGTTEFYHADCKMSNSKSEIVLNLFKANKRWTSEYSGNNISLYGPIGKAIDLYHASKGA